MPSVETERMRAVLFVEVNGEPYRCTLPNERMALLLQLAASLFDGQKLGLAPTTLFKFPPAHDGVTTGAANRPHCRDCADFAQDGICPNSGKPCAPAGVRPVEAQSSRELLDLLADLRSYIARQDDGDELYARIHAMQQALNAHGVPTPEATSNV